MAKIRVLKHLPRIIRKMLFLLWGLSTRAMTLGVKGVVQDEQGRVLLVRHTYVDGWHLPGGGVERGDTLAETVVKELCEETSIIVKSQPQLFHIYRNPRTSRFDHVAVFICKDWEEQSGWVPNSEIAERGFFPLGSLPDETTNYTRETLKEIFEFQPRRNVW